MIAVITYIHLRNPFKFFWLANHARKIIKQLRTTPYRGYKATGLWTKHYTMTLWNNKEEMQAFAMSGAHKESMKATASLAKELRTLIIAVDDMPDWKTAKAQVLTIGKVLKY